MLYKITVVAGHCLLYLCGVFALKRFPAGFIVWYRAVGPLLRNDRVSVRQCSEALFASVLICSPFALHQYTAYRTFCLPESTSFAERPSWCSALVPSIYNYVQAKYWNSGFLRYWTLAQLPNILLAVPVLLSIFSFTLAHLRACALPTLIRHPAVSGSALCRWLQPWCTPARSIFFEESITPHVIHSFIMCNILLFAAHTQIALRLAASMPVTYWAAARLMVEYPRAGKCWVTWSVVWGAVSVVLWAAFLPPA